VLGVLRGLAAGAAPPAGAAEVAGADGSAGIGSRQT
jgi:hypothetical protein